VPEDLELIMKMDGQLAELLMNKLRSDFKIDEEGVMYLRCVKALYGHIEAARLFYDDLNQTLTEKMNFVRNRYDPCVYNKRMDCGIVTARTHVDDIKFSAVLEDELTKVIDDLKEHYKEITIHEEDSHDYLGMIMMHDIKDQKVTIDMRKYISDCLDGFQDQEPDEKIKTVNTPATDHLF
jgi:hypothetical protein